jgi:phage shock protein E
MHTYTVDVRSEEEYRNGHKEGALHFDLREIMQGNLPPLPKDARIELYCASGNRSGVACKIMQENGFTDVHNIGGFSQ